MEDPKALERLSDALDELATHDAALAEIVDLRFFCGFSFAEIAALRGVSERTVKTKLGEEPHLFVQRARKRQPGQVTDACAPSIPIAGVR